MKKITTFLTVIAAAFAANAATVTWTAEEITDLADKAVVNGMTFNLNETISFTVDKGLSDKDALYRNTSDYPVFIQAYSKCTITFTANDADIKSIKFDVNTDQGKSPTPNWNIQDPAKTQYTETNPTWTGNVQEITFTVKSGAQITGLEIEYEGGVAPDPDKYKEATLLFNGCPVGKGTEAQQNVTISDNGVSIAFTSNSNSAQMDEKTCYFGTAEDFISTTTRYRPGGKSSKGVDSPNRGVITLPCTGTFYVYAFNNQADDRRLQIVQNSQTVFDHTYTASDCVDHPESTAEAEVKIYPIYSVELKKGTAYLLWPDNQVMLCGFKFVPQQSTTGVEDIVAAEAAEDNVAYDLMGRRVADSYKGIVIVNGKKFIRR